MTSSRHFILNFIKATFNFWEKVNPNFIIGKSFWAYLREGDLGEPELLVRFWLIWPLGLGKWGSSPAPEWNGALLLPLNACGVVWCAWCGAKEASVGSSVLTSATPKAPVEPSGGSVTKKTIYQVSWHQSQYSLFQSEVLSRIRNHSKQLLAWVWEIFFPQRCKDSIKFSQNLFSAVRRDLGRCISYQHNGLLSTAKHDINCGFTQEWFLRSLRTPAWA